MTTTTTNAPSYRIITLSDVPPVKISNEEWPQIACGDERPGSFVNGTPKPNYETDRFTIRVRQHADGRTIVYGVVDAATAWTGTESWHGGVLLPQPTGQEIVLAIRRLRIEGEMPESVERACIADLPPVAI